MKSLKPPPLPRALKTVRHAKHLPQEAFALVSSRTYVSALERGLKQPTLSKIADLAEVCEVHPLTLVALSFCRTGKPGELERLLATVSREVAELEHLDL